MKSKTLNKISKFIKTKRSKLPSPVVFANLEISGNSLKLEKNGNPSSIIMYYSGSCLIQPPYIAGIKYKATNRLVLINNPFGLNIPEILFYFDGNFKIERCFVYSFDGSFIKPDITNLSSIDNIDEKKLPVNLDNTIIQDPQEDVRKLKKFGVQKNNFSFVVEKPIEYYGKKEKEEKKSLYLRKVQQKLRQMPIMQKERIKITQQMTEKPIMQQSISDKIVAESKNIENARIKNEGKRKRKEKY